MSRIKIFNSESLVQNKKTQLYIIIQYCFPGRTWKLDTLTDLEQNIFLKQNKLLLKVYNKKITFTIKLLQLSLPSLKILFLSDYQEYRVRISDLFKDGHRTVWNLVPGFLNWTSTASSRLIPTSDYYYLFLLYINLSRIKIFNSES